METPCPPLFFFLGFVEEDISPNSRRPATLNPGQGLDSEATLDGCVHPTSVKNQYAVVSDAKT